MEKVVDSNVYGSVTSWATLQANVEADSRWAHARKGIILAKNVRGRKYLGSLGFLGTRISSLPVSWIRTHTLWYGISSRGVPLPQTYIRIYRIFCPWLGRVFCSWRGRRHSTAFRVWSWHRLPWILERLLSAYLWYEVQVWEEERGWNALVGSARTERPCFFPHQGAVRHQARFLLDLSVVPCPRVDPRRWLVVAFFLTFSSLTWCSQRCSVSHAT